MQSLPSTGRLTTSSALLFECPQGRSYKVCVTYSEANDAVATVNLHLKPSQDEKRRRIGKSTAMAANSTLEIGGDVAPICLYPGDSIWGDAATGTVDFVVTGAPA